MQTPGAEAIGSAKTEIVTRGPRQKSSDTRFDDGYAGRITSRRRRSDERQVLRACSFNARAPSAPGAPLLTPSRVVPQICA